MPARGIALVTGGAVRVGRGIAIALADAGFDVAFTYYQSTAASAATSAAIEARGRRALAIQCDLRAADAPAQVIASAQALGPLDVLVNSAASFDSDTLRDVTAASFDAQMALNARAPLLLAKHAATDLARDGRGRIIQIADLGAEQPIPGHLIHSMTKAALLNLTRGLAAELAPHTQVHAIVPGPVALPPGFTASERADELARTPVGREGSPEDVGEAVVFLATCSSFITGTIVHVDGGRHLFR